MDNSPTLVIMAAGAARRYGGLKQLAPVGPDRQALMEYSIYDARRAGFARVVLVVRREFETAFRDKFADRAQDLIEVKFAYQEPDAFVPTGIQTPERSKPWGTGHAVLCAKPHIPGGFAVINADDYYGMSAIAAVGQFLKSKKPEDTAAMVGYQLQNTLSDHGTVNRGICQVDASGWLTDIVELFEIAREPEDAIGRDGTGTAVPLALDTAVSMNLWGFHNQMLDHFERGFHAFLSPPPMVPRNSSYRPSSSS